jgi:cyclopropane-fatty-acyl-phospholipid synthase
VDNAHRILALAHDALGTPVPLRVRAWDGSEAGPPDAPTLHIRSRRALRHVLWSPGELGLARAYVSGDLDVDGDLTDALRRVWSVVRQARAERPEAGRMRVRTLLTRQPGLALRAGALALRAGAVGRRPPRPSAEAALSGDVHSTQRDQAAISHHYDLSNDFYELILDPHMAYSCAFFDRPEATLEQAQEAKLYLICRKLGLQPGMRMIDIGCGWGSLTLFAAEQYDVHVTAVTLSGEQRDYVLARAAERGLRHKVDVSLRHYRNLAASGVGDGSVDAIASIEMGEHVGDAEYADFAASIHRYLKPGGRALVQQMSRTTGDHPGGGPFIQTYIAPDMHMKPLAVTLAHFAAAGLEIRDVQAMREHYPRTACAWAGMLEQNWERVVALIGREYARVWRLYLAGGALAFEQNRMGVDQILMVKSSTTGVSGMPASPVAWLS